VEGHLQLWAWILEKAAIRGFDPLQPLSANLCAESPEAAMTQTSPRLLLA